MSTKIGYGNQVYSAGGYGGVTMTVTKEITFDFTEGGELVANATKTSAGVTNPYPNVEITVVDPDGDFSETKTTDENGQAVFTGLDSNQAYEATADPPDDEFDPETKPVDFTE